MAGFSQLAAEFAAVHTGLAAISADSGPALARLLAARAIPFPLLSDPDCRIIRAWGLYRPEHGGIARPALFWIGVEGQVRYAAEEGLAGRVPAREMLALAQAGANVLATLPRPRRQWPRLADWIRMFTDRK